ncbi:MAG: MEDS domain-containing protein, partial [Bdellovibrionales bacterium]|nr:MEDS domain-containing protein [Bdellovibrionales bacterium]
MSRHDETRLEGTTESPNQVLPTEDLGPNRGLRFRGQWRTPGFVAGEAVGWIFDSREHFSDTLLPFLQAGEAAGAEVAVVVGPREEESLRRELLESEGSIFDSSVLPFAQFCDSASGCTIENAVDAVCQLRSAARLTGRSSVRLLIDMAWTLLHPDSVRIASAFLHRLHSVLADNDLLVVCAFDHSRFSSTKLLNLLPLVPRLLLNGKVVENTFAAPLSRHSGSRHDAVLHCVLDALAEGAPRSPTPIGSPLTNNGALLTLEAIIDSMGDGVIVTDERGNLLMFNKTAECIYGFQHSRLPLELRVRQFGNYLPDMVTPYPLEELPITRALRGESADQVEIFLRNQHRPDGVWISATARPVRAKDGHLLGAVVVIRDITAVKRAAEETEQLRQQMYQSQKLESLGLLAGGIAHDFNNLLMGVLGNAGLAALEAPSDSALSARIEQIKTAATRLAELTHQLLVYSGRGSLHREPVDLSALVYEMQELLQTVVSKR